MTSMNPLTGEQKLLAEIIVQLGNVTEAIRDATTDGNTAHYQSEIASLQSEVTDLTSNNAGIPSSLLTPIKWLLSSKNRSRSTMLLM